MEVYQLVARRWKKGYSKKQLDKLLTKMVENANVIFSKKSDNIKPSRCTVGVSLMTLNWKHPCLKREQNSIFDACKYEADSKKYWNLPEFADIIFNDESPFGFKKAVISNGKTISLFHPFYEFKEYPAKGERPYLVYEGRRITDDSFREAALVTTKIVFFCRQDSTIVVSFIDLQQQVADGCDPAIREMFRTDRFASFWIEKNSGAYWWNSGRKIFREGRPMLTLTEEDSQKIYFYHVYEEYIVVILDYEETKVIKRDDGQMCDKAHAVYHRKSGARVLCFPHVGYATYILTPLTPRLHFIIIHQRNNRHLVHRNTLMFWLLSGDKCSRPMPKTSMIRKLDIFYPKCIKEGPWLNIYFDWKDYDRSQDTSLEDLDNLAKAEEEKTKRILKISNKNEDQEQNRNQASISSESNAEESDTLTEEDLTDQSEGDEDSQQDCLSEIRRPETLTAEKENPGEGTTDAAPKRPDEVVKNRRKPYAQILLGVLAALILMLILLGLLVALALLLITSCSSAVGQPVAAPPFTSADAPVAARLEYLHEGRNEHCAITADHGLATCAQLQQVAVPHQ